MFKEEMGDTLDPNGSSESSSKCNTKLYIIIGVAIAIVVVAVVVIVVVVTKGGDEDSKEMKVNLSSIPLPSGVIIDDGHYLFDGNIFICYNRTHTNYKYFGVISDDGKNFKELYGDVFIVPELANGIRLSLLEIINVFIWVIMSLNAMTQQKFYQNVKKEF